MRVAERDERVVTVGKKAVWDEVWEPGRGIRPIRGQTGFTRRPQRRRTWGQRDRTPVVTVSVRRSGRLSVAGLTAMRSVSGLGVATVCAHFAGKGKRRGMGEQGFMEFVYPFHGWARRTPWMWRAVLPPPPSQRRKRGHRQRHGDRHQVLPAREIGLGDRLDEHAHPHQCSGEPGAEAQAEVDRETGYRSRRASVNDLGVARGSPSTPPGPTATPIRAYTTPASVQM